MKSEAEIEDRVEMETDRASKIVSPPITMQKQTDQVSVRKSIEPRKQLSTTFNPIIVEGN